MKVSPLQPKGIVFEEVSILATLDETNTPISTDNFDFQDVRLVCDVGHADVDVDVDIDSPSDDSMLVSIRLRIPNEDGKKAPYKINIAVTGIFEWLNKSTDRTERRDLTVVNGATILYGAIREMVLTVTSRSMSGAMLLPSVNFIDNKPSLATPVEPEISSVPAIKRRSRLPREKA